MKTALYDQQGKKLTSSVELPDSVFAAQVNDKLLAQYVFVYLSNQRESNAHTKDRSEVSGGGRKPWKQKGTGRARVGSSRSPIWTKGGVTFGPTNERNYKKAMNRKAKQAAIRSAFSKLNADNQLFVLEKLEITGQQPAKQANALTDAFAAEKVTILTANRDAGLIQAFGNLFFAKVKTITEVSAYDLLNAGKVLLVQDCLSYINEKWAKEEVEEIEVKTQPKADSTVAKKTNKAK
jgi:large subunit ribosomal protein L4